MNRQSISLTAFPVAPAVRARVATAGLVLVGLLACTTSSTSPPPTGSLTVTISGQTGGAAPVVTVTGPDRIAHVLSATTTLTGLATGSYTIAPAPVFSGDPVVKTLYQATVSSNPVQVTNGGSASTQVTYSARSGSGGLWLVGGTNSGGNVLNWGVEYSAAQLTTTNSLPPAVKLAFPLTLGHNIDASGAAFDTSGNLWVVNDNSNTVVAYAPAQLAASGTPTPSITLSGSVIVAPYALAFDAAGNLWVANINIGTIVEFKASQILSSGTPTPAVTISEGNSSGPAGLAFDSAGNLWVTHNVANTVGGYTVAQIASGGSITPTVTLSGGALSFPQGIAFDTQGNLWVANTAVGNLKGTIVEYAKGLLATSGSPSPTLTLTPADKAGPVITGIAFDDSGDLWFIDLDAPSIGEYSAAQLAPGGNPQPSVVITTTVAGVGFAFNPHSAALPLH